MAINLRARVDWKIKIILIYYLIILIVYHIFSYSNDTYQSRIQNILDIDRRDINNLIKSSLLDHNNIPQQENIISLNEIISTNDNELTSKIKRTLIQYNIRNGRKYYPKLSNYQILLRKMYPQDYFNPKRRDFLQSRYAPVMEYKQYTNKRLFFYHMRKTGGTSVEHICKYIAKIYGLDWISSEGISLNHKLLELPKTISITSLRNPIERIISLYWYEHVMFHYRKGGDILKCKTFAEWIEGWRDGSTWKNKILANDPTTTYVEVQNYFIKSLIGWNTTNANNNMIGDVELEKAKKVLNDFDIVLLCEKLASIQQKDYILGIFPKLLTHKTIFGTHQVPRDATLQESLENKLMENKEGTLKLLGTLNTLDMKLYDYACDLVKIRLEDKFYIDRVRAKLNQFDVISSSGDRYTESTTTAKLMDEYRDFLGLKQPLLHKGPE